VGRRKGEEELRYYFFFNYAHSVLIKTLRLRALERSGRETFCLRKYGIYLKSFRQLLPDKIFRAGT